MKYTETGDIIIDTGQNKNKRKPVLDYILISRYFIPILTTVGWIIGCSPLARNKGVVIFSIILIVIGIVSTLTVSPIKYLKFIYTSSTTCCILLREHIAYYGVMDFIVGAIGFLIGLAIGLIVILGLPAIFTISKFIKERR